MSAMIGNPLLLTGGDYEISRSVRLRSSASATFSRTPASASNRRTWTWSAWVKRGQLAVNLGLFSANQTKDDITGFYINANDKLFFIDRPGNSTNAILATTLVFRDPSAWYHIMVVVDSTQATSANRIRFFVNGVQTTQHDAATYPSQNYEYAYINNTRDHRIGAFQDNTAQNFDGYLTEINFIDGQALTPSSFGETDAITGVWKPKKYTGTYGTNGFYLNFSDNSSNTATTIGKDYSGNGNNWTPNNISVTSGVTYDSMLDVPTLWADGGNGRGNYAVLNPLQSRSAPSRANLEFTQPNAGHGPTVGTIGMTTGKWYWEVEVTTFNSASSSIHIGIVGDNYPFASGNYIGNTATSYAYRHSAQKYNNASASAYGATYAAGDVIGVALDLDAGTLVFYKNNASQGTAYSGLSGTFYPGISIEQAGSTSTVQSNFGQRPFSYTPPSGFKALHTGNLPEPTIKKGNSFFDATLYAGNSSASSRLISNAAGFQPDLLWIKARNYAVDNNLYDALRGNGVRLRSNLTNAEDSGNGVALSSTGFTLTTNDDWHNGGYNYVAWQWKEGATQGFDIVTYTGDGTTNRTGAHGLGVQPSMLIIKARSAGTTSWIVHHRSLGNNGGSPAYLNYLQLESTAASAASTTLLPAAGMTSTTFPTSGATNNTNVNGNGTTYVAYLFSEVAGFSRFGSYTGNGSADGPFVFCGFRPRWVMVKRTDVSDAWLVFDTARLGYNGGNVALVPNSASSEGSTSYIDILSNGFKARQSNSEVNANGSTYIFMAVAENPFKLSLAR